MRRASYIDTKIDLNHQQEKVKKLKKLLQKTEMEWQNNWFNNLTGDKQEQYKKQVAEMKRITPSILWTIETGKIQVEWKRNWFKNLTEDKKEKYYTEINKIKTEIKKENNL
ncbi:MAG: hypothetical protein EIB84_06475 [Spiroplasma poulsonii]|uniref:Uncharacterized protein n=1 Tax=Spiroplasma poulsonii TaxID=2138 RepID=A0A2R6Y5M1_9MOLU|nr:MULTISPECIES: hypothetical protein [Spiroplasma]KAF0849745.1 hypothetical protein MSROBK_P00140 [Spiroplasma poulsonii]KAF0849750.1 hypothetical protein MSROBK_P00190 [Spiroplasma poulsonii]KAF0849769.1 hypothetical protein MSROBK_P00380 [Spiroplasma poulsonii]MBH8623314.1 hypothetical protein [Spiroplasma sp. hyd1]MBW1242403.1 hypothetical protein [Spiroplasma poulsonii]